MGCSRRCGVTVSFLTCVPKEKGYGIDVGYRACKEILAAAPETTCIMASNNLAAMGVINAAREIGLDVPERLSVTGADGVEFYGQVALTTYASPSYAIGREAARLLRLVVEKTNRKPEHIKMPVQFIPGATVAKPGRTTPSRQSGKKKVAEERRDKAAGRMATSTKGAEDA